MRLTVGSLTLGILITLAVATWLAADGAVRATVACAQEEGQELGTCEASVIRTGDGAAEVTVTFPNGFARKLYFEAGAFTHASATMSGTGRRDLDWTREGDLHKVRVDDQRFELPHTFVFGE